MTWVTFRQHRWPLLLGALLVVVVAAALLATGDTIREQAGSTAYRSAKELPAFGGMRILVGLVVLVLPAAGGVFVGAPLLAQELEQRTHDLAWTQSITRRRWLLVKLGLLAVAVVAVAGTVAAVVTWWERPLVDHGLSGPWGWFDHGLTLPAYALFAFALGVAVGTLTGRTVVAMAVTLAVYASARYAVTAWWRPRYRAPVETVTPLGRPLVANGADGRWVIDAFLVDGQGHRLTDEQAAELPQLHDQVGGAPGAGLFSQHVLAHPADRLIQFELIEAGIFVALAALLIGLAVWWIQHRTS